MVAKVLLCKFSCNDSLPISNEFFVISNNERLEIAASSRSRGVTDRRC